MAIDPKGGKFVGFGLIGVVTIQIFIVFLRYIKILMYNNKYYCLNNI